MFPSYSDDQASEVEPVEYEGYNEINAVDVERWRTEQNNINRE